MPAQITAKSVIASAARLIDVRHFCREQEQDRRDQRAGVADTDPEHEVGDVPRPADRVIQSPDADAGRDLIAEAEQPDRRDQRADRKRHPPPARRRAFDHAGDALGDPAEVAIVQHQRHARELPLDRGRSLRRNHVRNCGRAAPSAITDVLPGSACQDYAARDRASPCSSWCASPSRGLAMPMRCASGIFGFGLRMRAR